ncbi:MAG: SusC/RagA family TonB-linked outer membrane protein, partial [Draconibacterium sp.]|nr:SusC/RagA family TonB-linked outer membrane protein [Draconibacterium sp.]
MKKKVLQMLLFGVFALFTSSIYAQSNVSGVVTSDSGELLPGVTIVIKGTSQGTVTDLDGKFALAVSDAQATLVFSFVGMESQEVALNGKTIVDVTLIATSIGIDDVVVTALGISRDKKAIGYAVDEVNSEDIAMGATANYLKNLEGKVTGVTFTSLSSDPTSSSFVVIRGATSIAGLQS